MIQLKQGDTLTLAGTALQGSGAAVNLTGSTLRAQVRPRNGGGFGAVVQELTYAVVSATSGTFTLSATSAQTALWPTGRLACDLELTDSGGAVVHSETIDVHVRAAVTQ
jgi:hypothetical protein